MKKFYCATFLFLFAINIAFADDFVIGGGGAVGFADNTQIGEIESQFGFSAYAGYAEYFSIFLDILFYKPTLIGDVEGAEAKATLTNFTFGAHYPVYSKENEPVVKIGLGYTTATDKVTISYLGSTEEGSAQASGICFIGVVDATNILFSLRYSVFENNGNAKGHLILSTAYKL